MRRSRTSSTGIHGIRIAVLLFVVHRAAAFLNCQILYQAHSGYNASVPQFLYCFGSGQHGNWSKIENGTHHLIANFNATDVEMEDQDGGYGVTVTPGGKKGWIRTFLNATRGTHGTFVCTMDNQTSVLRVPMLLRTGGMYYGNYSVGLQCMPKHENASRPEHLGHDPYNITWFLNSTIVGWSKIENDTWANVTYNTNTSFVELKNVTIHGNFLTATGARPLCLTCLLGQNGGFGLSTLCSPNTKDLSVNHSTIEDVLPKKAHSARLETEDADESGGSDGSNGGDVLLGATLFACAVAGLLWLIRLRKKGRSDIGPLYRGYRPFGDRTVRVYEEDEPSQAVPLSAALSSVQTGPISQ